MTIIKTPKALEIAQYEIDFLANMRTSLKDKKVSHIEADWKQTPLAVDIHLSGSDKPLRATGLIAAMIYHAYLDERNEYGKNKTGVANRNPDSVDIYNNNSQSGT